MSQFKDLTEPLKIYGMAKEAYHQNAEDYFNELVKKTNTNLDANKAKCDEYYKKVDEISNTNKILKKKKNKKGWFIFLTVLCFITIILIPLAIYLIKKIKNQINSEIANINEEINKKNAEAEKIKDEAYDIAAELNASYDYNDAGKIYTKTIPLVEMDRVFDNKKFALMSSKYGFGERDGDDVSTVDVISGSILGNPFLVEKTIVQATIQKVYTGSITISWTTRDSEGHTQYHTQVLTATVTKPAPSYYYKTWLIYGNDAAPKLNFSRSPSGANSMSDKQIERMTKKAEKKLDKLAKKDLDFTKMANTEFDTLFGAVDRDNEVEFRLLFTPLAQKNMVDLIKSKIPYGDDFDFIKEGPINYVACGHCQTFEFENSPANFVNFDIAKSKELFITYCDSYFQNLYFNFAPLMSIPLYSMHKAQEYIYRDNHKGLFTTYEAESMAYGLNRNSFRPAGTTTDIILRSKFVSKNKDTDIYSITSYSFTGIPRVTSIPVYGGDGHTHMVPVHWIEYIKHCANSKIALKDTKLTRYEYLTNNKPLFGNGISNENIYFQKGLISAIIK